MARILVINHGVSIQNLLLEVLEDEGYNVVEAHNRYEGIPRDETEPSTMAPSDIMYLMAFNPAQL